MNPEVDLPVNSAPDQTNLAALASCRRRVLDRPSDVLVTDAGVVARRELAAVRPL
ncbi:MAG: hypothetical protein JWR32_4163 [Mycobacterium sp.]|jgi:hypothetical protein|nr:hypothetical protein [Mycobacterium sp.]